MLIAALLFTVGLVALYFGAEWLVAGSSSAALRLGIAPLVVGLTVVAFGTSAPELLVSALAVHEGRDGISLGNIIGSNIANIALILGAAAVVRPVAVSHRAVRRDYPVMLAASAALVAACLDAEIARWEGAIGLAALALYLGVALRRGLAHGGPASAEDEALLGDLEPDEARRIPLWKDALRVVVGIAALAGGAALLVENATYFAELLNISDVVIGVTVVAIGTSLPELATSLVASTRGEADISVGNVIGSNIFNVLLVIGAVAVARPIAVAPGARIDLVIMLGASLLIWPIMRTRYCISRWEGALLLVAYAAYMGYQAFWA